MATVREGNKGALMVVDVQVGVMRAAWEAPRIIRNVAPAPGELLIPKRFNSAFEETPLKDELARLGATHIALAGASTNFCIRATAYAALDRGYDLTLIKDAHSTDTLELEGGVRIDAATIIHDLNITMTWLSYPGRQNATATAEQIDFAAPGAGASRAAQETNSTLPKDEACRRLQSRATPPTRSRRRTPPPGASTSASAPSATGAARPWPAYAR